MTLELSTEEKIIVPMIWVFAIAWGMNLWTVK